MLERTRKQELTSRQFEILRLLHKGLTNGEICRTLNISENTVKVHLANIYKIMDVTNRTEAVSASKDFFSNPVKKQEVRVIIGHNDDIKNFPLAHNLFLSIIEALHGYRLFQIKLCQMNEVTDDCIYQIKLSVPQKEEQSLHITLHQADDSSLLWSTLQKIESSDQLPLLATRIAIQLYRHMQLSATEVYIRHPKVSPAWWYASSYASIKMENLCMEDFETCRNILEILLQTEINKDYISCTLASTYYLAIEKLWVDPEEFTRRIGEIACATMRETPNSTNSMFTIALYNILIEKKNEAIDYLEGILTVNPLCINTRKVLAQVYQQMGQKDKAARELKELERFTGYSIPTRTS